MELPANIVVHIGMSKAGSTAIQNVLDASYDDLLAKGILFPRSVLTRKDTTDPTRTSGHLELVRQLRKGEPDELAKEIARGGRKLRTLVLSAENMFLDVADDDLARLRTFLQDRPITLAALMRSQDSWLLSRYYESVTKGYMRETSEIDTFALRALYGGRLDYQRRLDEVTEILLPEQVEVWDYDHLARYGAVLERFLDLIGAEGEPTLPPETERSNVSTPYPEALEAHRQLNHAAQKLKSAAYRAWCARMRTEYRIEAAGGNLTQGYLLPSLTIRKAMLHNLWPANAALAERFFGGASFGPDRSWLDRESPEPDPAMVAELVERGTALIDAVQNDKAAA